MNESEIKQIVDARIKELFGNLLGLNDPKDIEFLPTNQAYKKLGYPSAKALRVAVENGTLRLGIEVQDRRSPDSIYASYYFNVPACIKRLNIPPEKRA
jgi:hypothetical protein